MSHLKIVTNEFNGRSRGKENRELVGMAVALKRAQGQVYHAHSDALLFLANDVLLQVCLHKDLNEEIADYLPEASQIIDEIESFHIFRLADTRILLGSQMNYAIRQACRALQMIDDYYSGQLSSDDGGDDCERDQALSLLSKARRYFDMVQDIREPYGEQKEMLNFYRMDPLIAADFIAEYLCMIGRNISKTHSASLALAVGNSISSLGVQVKNNLPASARELQECQTETGFVRPYKQKHIMGLLSKMAQVSEALLKEPYISTEEQQILEALYKISVVYDWQQYEMPRVFKGMPQP